MKLCLILFVGIGGALLLTGCATTNTQPGPTIAKTKFVPTAAAEPRAGTTVLDQAALTAAHAFFESAKAPDSTEKAATVFRTGRALLDHYCNEYLDALGSANQKAGNERKQAGLFSGFASAVMGLTGSSAKDIAAVASTFSFAQASMDAFTTSYLFSDAASSITKLVRDAQTAYLKASEEQIEALDYPGAVSLLGGYEQICRPSQIRTLIDQAIAAARIVTDAQGTLPDDLAVLTLLDGLTGALGTTVAEGDAIALYAWFISNDVNSRTAIQGQSNFLDARTADAAAQAALVRKISPILLPLTLKDNAIAKRWAPAVAKLTATKAVPAKAALTVVPVPRVKQ